MWEIRRPTAEPGSSGAGARPSQFPGPGGDGEQQDCGDHDGGPGGAVPDQRSVKPADHGEAADQTGAQGHLLRRRRQGARRRRGDDQQRGNQQQPDQLEADGDHHGEQNHEDQPHAGDGDALDLGEFFMNGRRQQRPPDHRHDTEGDRAAAVYPGQVAPAHRQYIAEQVRQQVDAQAFLKCDDDQSQGEGSMSDDTEQRIVG